MNLRMISILAFCCSRATGCWRCQLGDVSPSVFSPIIGPVADQANERRPALRGKNNRHKYFRTSDREAARTSLEHRIKIIPDIPQPFEDGIKTILEDLARSNPGAKSTYQAR